MNFIDVLIIFLVVAFTVRGVAAGFFRQLGSLGGFLIGLLVGALVAPLLSGFLPITPTRPLLIFLLFLAVAVTLSGLGEALGARLSKLLHENKLGPIDGVLGAGFGFIATLIAVWLIAGSFGRTAGPIVATDIASSRILQALDSTLPPAPEVTAKLERLIGASRFPRVFSGLEPTPAPPVTGPNAEAVNAAVAAARSATVRVEGAGCGGVVGGTGFVVGPGLVATNAHVVAGISRPIVTDAAGTHRATVVHFDPGMDFAVLRTTGLAAAPLTLEPRVQPRGTIAAALGFPGGGNFTAGAAAVLERQTAVGRNIYDTGLVRRDIYVLQATVRPGNSGGPLVAPDGTVIGVIFAASTTNPNVGYALTSTEVIPHVARAASRQAPVNTGACLVQ